ncbi:MAG: hypothetical protein PHC61_08590, partial [Chitinivibrionales bacterium]|nr:hypothetical protein [Chitinivibrionales bacterium]
MKKSFLIFLLFFLLQLGLAAPIIAADAEVTWGTPTGISADADVSTTGSFVYAYRIGWSSFSCPGNVTINGVTFTGAYWSGGAFTGSGGALTDLTATAWCWAGGDGDGSYAGAPYTSLSSAYQDLLHGAVFSLTGNPNFILNNLTTGTQYQVQIWVNYSGNYGTSYTESITSGGQSVTLYLDNPSGSGQVGQWVTGTFTA